MKVITKWLLPAIFLVACANSVVASDSTDYHPFLSDQFNIDLGVFLSNSDFKIKVNGQSPDVDTIDLNGDAKLSHSQNAGSINFRWRFGEKWSLWAQYWATDINSKATLKKDIVWRDVTFKAGSSASIGTKLNVSRIFFGREFSIGPQHEFGAGVGLHIAEFGASIAADAILDDGNVEFQKRKVNASVPLPNIGAWYMYSWSPKWIVQTRVDWLSLSLGDYSGGFWDIQAGVNYQLFRNIGIGLYYKAFLIDVDVDKDNWNGGMDISQAGPVLTFTGTW